MVRGPEEEEESAHGRFAEARRERTAGRLEGAGPGAPRVGVAERVVANLVDIETGAYQDAHEPREIDVRYRSSPQMALEEMHRPGTAPAAHLGARSRRRAQRAPGAAGGVGRTKGDSTCGS